MIEWTRSFVELGVYNANDTVLQTSRCSFDFHVEDIIGTLIVGGTLVMLSPKGLNDLTYFVDILDEKKITYFFGVPSYLSALGAYLDTRSKETCLTHVRSVVAGGMFIFIFSILRDCDRNISCRRSIANARHSEIKKTFSIDFDGSASMSCLEFIWTC